jgi:hypothetical protein
MVTLFIASFAFANAFYLLGRNQIQFDEVSQDDVPSYATFSGAVFFIYQISLGEVYVIDSFTVGNNPQQYYPLWVIFILSTFTLLVHMLNMLIAIMGETFAKYGEVREQITLKNKLKFVIDNWSLKKAAFGKEMQKINFLVAALLNEEDDEDIEIIKDIQEDFHKMKYLTKTRHEDIKV